MGQEKQKKSSLEKVVIAFNVIAIILMVGIIIISLFMSKELSTTYGPPDLQQQMVEMQISSFNSKFTTYEGIRTGSQVKALIETVNANNESNDGTEFVVSINEKTNENQYTFNGDSVRKYKVEIEYDNDLVSNINIYKSKTQNEINSVSTNYTEFAEITGTMQEGSIGKVYNTIERNNVEENNANFMSVLFGILIWIIIWFLIWLPIFLPFIIINMVVYNKCKSIAENMNTASCDYDDIKKRQKFLLLLLVFTDIAFCVISYFWLKYLESAIIHNYSIM